MEAVIEAVKWILTFLVALCALYMIVRVATFGIMKSIHEAKKLLNQKETKK